MELLTFIISHNYFILFLLFVIEGMAVNILSAFASSLGYFDIKVIIILAIIGNTITDNLFYFIGRGFLSGREKLVKKDIVKKLSKLCQNNLFFGLLLIKISGFAPLGLTFIGATKTEFKRYFYLSLVTTFIFVVIFTSIGYFYGASTKFILKFITNGQYILFSCVFLLIIFYLIHRKIKKKIIKN